MKMLLVLFLVIGCSSVQTTTKCKTYKAGRDEAFTICKTYETTKSSP
jgi:uncharacterized protein YceK